jgi:hypothetical protein
LSSAIFYQVCSNVVAQRGDKVLKLSQMAAWVFLILAVTGCQFTSRIRTLPEEIQSVYIPMFINNTYQPGLEELATRATVEAFLADGRLQLVSPREADVVVQGIIQEYTDKVSGTESDEFPMMNTINARAMVKLYASNDRMNPLNEYKSFTVSRSYISDVRRMDLTIPEDAIQNLMEALGERVVLEVLTGQFKEISP